MKLDTLAASAAARIVQPPAQAIEITGIACDSRAVQPGELFAALPGAKADGTAYAKQAAERGAAAILCQTMQPLTPLPQLVCEDARLGLARAARAFFGFADRRMKMGAVTGTNGKTTTAYLIRHLLQCSGQRCGMIGTIEYDVGAKSVTAPLTTPESLDLHRYLRAMADAGCNAAFMETSSHALCQHRVAGIAFSTAIFTNLTQDHLDYHRTMEEYREAKAILFRNLPLDATAVLNIDDAASAYYASVTPARVLWFTLNPQLASSVILCGRIRSMSIRGTRFEMQTPWGTQEIEWGLVGAHNVQNCLGAVAAAVSMGAPFETVVRGLATFRGVPGRLQSVGDEYGKLPFRVLVDYAHTDDALRSVLTALRQLKPTRVIAVFGCGGNRDRAKRPKMARAVEEMANLGVVTSDNPRHEDPQAIIADICGGIRNQGKFMVEADRAKAIEMAIREARAGDVVLIAGKGHEDYQIFGAEKRHFSDVEQAAAALSRRFGPPKEQYAAAGS
jgi:UDP-N-acetylmuramoyl-L-alanyl-D-glutamate--2,6-diaminopimelate ligase